MTDIKKILIASICVVLAVAIAAGVSIGVLAGTVNGLKDTVAELQQANEAQEALNASMKAELDAAKANGENIVTAEEFETKLAAALGEQNQTMQALISTAVKNQIEELETEGLTEAQVQEIIDAAVANCLTEADIDAIVAGVDAGLTKDEVKKIVADYTVGTLTYGQIVDLIDDADYDLRVYLEKQIKAVVDAVEELGGDIKDLEGNVGKLEGELGDLTNDFEWSESVDVKVPATSDKTANTAALSDAIANANSDGDEVTVIELGAGEYKLELTRSETKNIVIGGTKETVIDLKLGAYMDNGSIAFEGVTILGSTGRANGNGSDYAALYVQDVTYTNCHFVGAFRVGRNGAQFINCTFDLSDGGYVWTMQNNVVFDGCTFNTAGKALLLYADGNYGNTEAVRNVTVKNCVFNATAGAKAGAIANQNCAAIEIDNYGCGYNLTIEGNVYDSDYFSGEWRLKTYDATKIANTITVDGVAYTTIAIDGKAMTIDSNKNVTVID